MCPAGNNDYCKIIIATRVNVNTRLDIVRIFAIPLIERKLDILTRATYCIKPNEISNYIFDTIKICFNDIFLFLSLSLALEEAVFFQARIFRSSSRERWKKRERGKMCRVQFHEAILAAEGSAFSFKEAIKKRRKKLGQF